MNSIKAIVTGIIFIIVALLMMQLAYLLVAVAYNSLAKSYPFLNDISGVFRYLIAIPVILGIMFVGGYLTADIASSSVLMHCLVVGIITSGGSLWMALENADLTITGALLSIMMLLITVAGGLYWQKNSLQ